MIYLVTNRTDLPSMNGIKLLSVEDSLSMIRGWPVVQFDTETTGTNCHVNKTKMFQFGYEDMKTGDDNQIVVDVLTVDPKLYKDVIEKSYLIGQNLKFDLEFLYNDGIIPLNLYDTMICEQVLYMGHNFKRVGFGLNDLYRRYTGQELNKSFQKKIADSGLTEQSVKYAANDVKQLQLIRMKQMMLAKSRNCENAFVLENRFVPAIAYLEWCGIHLDEQKWKDKMNNDQTRYDSALNSLNDYVRSHPKLNKRFISNVTQLDLFSDITSSGPEVIIDWSSSKQVIPVFKELGFKTEVFDKESHKTKDSIEWDIISVQKGIDDKFLEIYKAYKEAEKKTSTYGQNFLNLINPNTGRLHTEFRQIGTVTGRMASGGGTEGESDAKGKMDRELARLKGLPPEEVRYVNMQNLPSRGEEGKITRACFTPMEGNEFISVDYSSQESRVQGMVWKEEKLLDSFRNGIDMHSVYAKMCFPEELKDIDVRDVKKLRPDLRQAAKGPEFTVSYGGKGSTDEERKMIEGILSSMKGMAAFKKKTVKFLKEHGYIVIHPLTGHRIYWPQWSEWRSEEDRMDREFWNNYAAYHKGTGDEVNRFVIRHNKKSHDWFEKNVLNYPIQGGSALVLKQSMTDFFHWVVKRGYFGKVLLCVCVHDEADIECPIEISDEVSSKLKDIMEIGAAKFYDTIPIPAEVSAGDHWIH